MPSVNDVVADARFLVQRACLGWGRDCDCSCLALKKKCVEGHQVDAMRLASPCPMRRSPMPSLFEDHAAISFRGVCGRARCRGCSMESLLEGLPGDARQQEVVTQIASLPMRMGGIG